jgi:hypothetical protein
MFDTAGITEGIRDEGAAVRDRSMEWRQRRLKHKVEALHDELDREREARRALADAMGSSGRGKRRHGFLRVLVIGGGAYILGARAGHERYDQMTGWIRGLRDRIATTARGVQDEAVQTAGQVRDVALDTARVVGEDVKSTATQVRAEAADGARQVSEETGDAVRRMKKELASADAADV